MTRPEHDDWFKDAQASAESLGDDARIQLWRQLAAERPDSPLPHLMLGAEYAQTGATPLAEEAYASALLLAPELHIARFQLGLLHFCNARPASALLCWQNLAALPDPHPLKLFSQAFAALAANEPGLAVDLLEKGITANSDNDALNHDMGLMIERLRGGNEGDEHAPDYHFLLANYRNAGKMH